MSVSVADLDFEAPAWQIPSDSPTAPPTESGWLESWHPA
jgi:hypothetical protein